MPPCGWVGLGFWSFEGWCCLYLQNEPVFLDFLAFTDSPWRRRYQDPSKSRKSPNKTASLPPKTNPQRYRCEEHTPRKVWAWCEQLLHIHAESTISKHSLVMSQTNPAIQSSGCAWPSVFPQRKHGTSNHASPEVFSVIFNKTGKGLFHNQLPT